jgi:hypothetical protein
MGLSYAQVAKRAALLNRLTGLTTKEFEALLKAFGEEYDKQVVQAVSVQREEDKREHCRKWRTNCSSS